jgi:subtilase family serine protease
MAEDPRKVDPFVPVPQDHQPPYVEPTDAPYKAQAIKQNDIQNLLGTPGTSDARIPDVETVSDEGGKVGQPAEPGKVPDRA